MSQKNEVKRWMSSHPGPTRDMREVVFAKDYDSLKEENAKLREALRISADKHEGMALCLEAHGTNLNIPFLINDCRADAARDRKALTGGQDVSKD